ncbi:MAG: riboflavin synthase [Thermotogae bacterium]|nr:riboflavin synthase [Thermotogota bacterium]
MFSGIVEGRARIEEVIPVDRGKRVVWRFPEGVELEVGQSVALDGACLTVEEILEEAALFYLSDETLRRTKFSQVLIPGYISNYERALKIGDRIDGHIVLGHVDGVARLVSVKDLGEEGLEWTLEVPSGLAKYVAPKGSVALDGTSLTVNSVSDFRFTVRLIPHTLKITALGLRGEGDPLNFEVDVVARYVERLMEFLR